MTRELFVGDVWRRNTPLGDEYDLVRVGGVVDEAGQRPNEYTLKSELTFSPTFRQTRAGCSTIARSSLVPMMSRRIGLAMSRLWTDEQRLRASASAARWWRAKVLIDPASSKLKKARALRLLTQKDLSALSGVAVGTLVAAEAGGEISPYVQQRLARVLAPPELFD
jgi:DNA-binding XRE family transcriptional regulator